MPAIYTRTGDLGETALYGGSRLAKDAARVEAYGTLDEANAAIGQAKALLDEGWMTQRLRTMQRRLFVLSAEVASDATGRERLADLVGDADVTALEHLIDRCLGLTGPPTSFVLPGADPASAALHVARTQVRRAERRLVALSGPDAVRPELIRYVNRLSDALYALARVVERRGVEARLEQIVRDAVATVLARAAAPTQTAAPAHQEATMTRTFDLTVAKTMAEAAERSAAALGVPVVFAAVDAGGNLMLVHRQGDSLLGSIDLAIGKAYTAAAFKQTTAQLGEAARVDGPLHGIEASNNGRVVIFGGGVPLFADGQLVGGVGVSGGTVEEDIQIVNDALSAGWRN